MIPELPFSIPAKQRLITTRGKVRDNPNTSMVIHKPPIPILSMGVSLRSTDLIQTYCRTRFLPNRSLNLDHLLKVGKEFQSIRIHAYCRTVVASPAKKIDT
jgi:hypothetical protein